MCRIWTSKTETGDADGTIEGEIEDGDGSPGDEAETVLKTEGGVAISEKTALKTSGQDDENDRQNTPNDGTQSRTEVTEENLDETAANGKAVEANADSMARQPTR